jgi:maltooligosyltrehalose trehalohydrolase
MTITDLDTRDSDFARAMPIGAEVLPTGGVHFRVWAPKADALELELIDSAGLATLHGLMPEEDGYWSLFLPAAANGHLYRYKLGDGFYPDPASRRQPNGPHAASEIVDPQAFTWTDQGWSGLSPHEIVLYEMHIGTYTKEGTFRAAAEKLTELADLGITMLELMPLGEFDGAFGWGYDVVAPFAPYHHYGAPDDLRHFVDTAHKLGIGVILDVVYNHFGPCGSYHRQFSDAYFSSAYTSEWGESINFDGDDSLSVREYFIANAAYWIREFHFDGLRLDATQFIYDKSDKHVIGEITKAARRAGAGRHIHIVGENEPQDTRALLQPANKGFGIDSLWNDDFHHACNVALRGKTEAYFNDYKGAPQEFISCIKYGFLYQGQWYAWQKQPRGKPALGIEPYHFVNFMQNHDQIANSGIGKRIHEISHPGDCRAFTALMLIAPQTPLLFQGQEYWASAPFQYFADHDGELADSVNQGRKTFLHQFPSLAARETQQHLSRPHDVGTFHRCKLDHHERVSNAAVLQMHKDLLHLRRAEPAFAEARFHPIDGAVLGEKAFVIRFFGAQAEDTCLLMINYGLDLKLSPMPEPLLAPPLGFTWDILWSSEHPDYGGNGIVPFTPDERAMLSAHSAIILKAQKSKVVKLWH